MEYKTIVINSRSSYWSNKESGEELLVDTEDLSKELDKQTKIMIDAGYSLFSITPIQSGNISNGNGYIHTSSLMVTFTK